jgi:hypothetical protein
MRKRLLSADVLFAMAMLLVSVAFFVAGMKFNRPTPDGLMNEGVFPQIIALVVGLLSIAIIVKGIQKNTPYFAVTEKQRGNLKALFQMIGLFVLYIIAWRFVHFLISTTVLLAGMCRILKFKWRFTLIFSVIFAVSVFFLFTEVFSIML